MKTMEKAKATEGKQVGIRLDGALLSELESLQKTLIPNGDLTLSQVIRLILRRGVQGVKEDALKEVREVADTLRVMHEAAVIGFADDVPNTLRDDTLQAIQKALAMVTLGKPRE